jgi:hypothetical protein
VLEEGTAADVAPAVDGVDGGVARMSLMRRLGRDPGSLRAALAQRIGA